MYWGELFTADVFRPRESPSSFSDDWLDPIFFAYALKPRDLLAEILGFNLQVPTSVELGRDPSEGVLVSRDAAFEFAVLLLFDPASVIPFVFVGTVF